MQVINEVLTQLGELPAARRELDERERELIEAAREGGAGWAAIAEALGLRSRQAAEQRWLRLCAAGRRDPQPERTRRREQQIVDKWAGAPISQLRRAAMNAYRQVKEPELLRQTLEAAIDAPPGALFELARQALADAEGTENAAKMRGLREALTAAMP